LVSLTGVQARGEVNAFGVAYWTLIDDSQNPNWNIINTAQTPTWQIIDTDQSPNWEDVEMMV